MAETASDYHHGDQDPSENVASYKLFLNLAKWGALHTAVVTLFLTLWFCTGAGFLGALITAIIVSVLGVWLLRARHHDQP